MEVIKLPNYPDSFTINFNSLGIGGIANFGSSNNLGSTFQDVVNGVVTGQSIRVTPGSIWQYHVQISQNGGNTAWALNGSCSLQFANTASTVYWQQLVSTSFTNGAAATYGFQWNGVGLIKASATGDLQLGFFNGSGSTIIPSGGVVFRRVG